ncbi:MAG: hypothetical protein AB7V16_02640 [Vulcanibacillus sp.]
MRLGIDIDGTIKYTHSAAIKLYNEELNMNVREEEVVTYFLDEPFGLTSDEGRKMWRRLESRIYTIAIPLENSSESLQQLEEEGHEIFYITARPGLKKIREVTEYWLQKYHFPYKKENLFMSSQNKGKIAIENNIHLFFEDDPNHIDNLVANGVPTVIVDCPYNRLSSKDIPRIKDWIEGINYVHMFEKKLNI